jgi:hypothetical protein
MINWNELDNPWHYVDDPPYISGRYIVVQENNGKKYRWIRYWDGKDWCNANMDKYGEVTYWAELLDYP